MKHRTWSVALSHLMRSWILRPATVRPTVLARVQDANTDIALMPGTGGCNPWQNVISDHTSATTHPKEPLEVEFGVTVSKRIKYQFVVVKLEVPDADGAGISAVRALRAVIQQVVAKHDAAVVIEIESRQVGVKIAIFHVKIGSSVHVCHSHCRVR